MSVNVLNKLIAETEKLEAEISMLQKSPGIMETLPSTIDFMDNNPEPFHLNRTKQNPWVVSPSGGCSIS